MMTGRIINIITRWTQHLASCSSKICTLLWSFSRNQSAFSIASSCSRSTFYSLFVFRRILNSRATSLSFGTRQIFGTLTSTL